MEIKNFFFQVSEIVKKNPLRAILILGFLHGVIYVFMIPLWWHHEEPGHFEYVWLAANRAEWPQPGEYDNDLRKEIAESMFASGQENLFNVSPRSLDDDPIYIGGSPVGRKGAYYWLASWPIKLIRNQSVVLQLYIIRLISLLMFLVSIWLAWLFMGELVNKRHPLRWMIPFFLALLPGYLDNMTSVHDDVLGGVVAALFLWLSVRGIKQGFSILSFIGWIISIVLCFYSRDTTVPLVFLAPLVPIFRVLKQKTYSVMAIVFLFAAVIVSVKLFTFQDASQWFDYPASEQTTRFKTTQAPFGDFVFSLSNEEGEKFFGQSFPPSFIKPLRKKTLTLGVWIWASEPTELYLPIIQYRTPEGIDASPKEKVRIETTPVFYTTKLYIPYEASHTWLSPLPILPEKPLSHIYYDGFVLAEGEYSSVPPVFDDEKLHSGVWDGKPFENIVRNPSAERAWLGVTQASQVLKLRSYIEPALFLQTIQDIQGFGWYNRAALSTLFQSFWGVGAGTEIPLMGGFTYNFLKIVSVLVLLGSVFYIRQSSFLLKKPELLFILIVILIIWVPTFFRGTYWVFYFVPLVPYARYAFPAFIPTVLLISAGLLKISQWVMIQYKLEKSFPPLVFQTFMFSLAIYALFSFGGYFHAWIQNTGFFVLLATLNIVVFMGLKNIVRFK
ncbi:MAG: hypothetical protein GY755_01800 [Chloroflexi bacterium]|nr:hypothetical protein [Chloroflexota bacterium]